MNATEVKSITEMSLDEINVEIMSMAASVPTALRIKFALDNACSPRSVDRYFKDGAPTMLIARTLFKDMCGSIYGDVEGYFRAKHDN